MLKGAFRFSFLYTDSGLVMEMEANAFLKLGPIGTVSVVGAFRIDSGGLVALVAWAWVILKLAFGLALLLQLLSWLWLLTKWVQQRA